MGVHSWVRVFELISKESSLSRKVALSRTPNPLLSLKVKNKIFMDFPCVACCKFLWKDLNFWALSSHPRKNFIHENIIYVSSGFKDLLRLPKRRQIKHLALQCMEHRCSWRRFRLNKPFPSALRAYALASSLIGCVILTTLVNLSRPQCHYQCCYSSYLTE